MFRNAYVVLTLTMLFWGCNAVAGKLAVGHISPMMLTCLRWMIAFAIILAIGHRQFRQDWPQVRQHLPVLFALGTAGFALFNGTMYTALNYTSVINVSIEQAGMPMVIFAANFLLFRMKVTSAQLVGFVLSLVGVAFAASHGDLTRLAQLDLNTGDSLMLLALLLYGGFTVALRYKPQLHWKSLMIAMSGAAAIASLPLVALEFALGAGRLPDARGWGIAAFTAVFPSLLAQTMFMRGVEMIGGNRAGLFINLVPIFGTILSIVVLGEAFFAYHAAALAMVLGGIWLAEYSGRKTASRDRSQELPPPR